MLVDKWLRNRFSSFSHLKIFLGMINLWNLISQIGITLYQLSLQYTVQCLNSLMCPSNKDETGRRLLGINLIILFIHTSYWKVYDRNVILLYSYIWNSSDSLYVLGYTNVLVYLELVFMLPFRVEHCWKSDQVIYW